jgi:hypothetical protein
MIKTFDFKLLADINWETKVDKGLHFFSDLPRHFEIKNYGQDVRGIALVMMCRSPELMFKQRKRFSKADKKLFLDIMLDYDEMVKSDDDFARAKIIYNKISAELFTKLEKYKFRNFDLTGFKADFAAFARTRNLT